MKNRIVKRSVACRTCSAALLGPTLSGRLDSSRTVARPYSACKHTFNEREDASYQLMQPTEMSRVFVGSVRFQASGSHHWFLARAGIP